MALTVETGEGLAAADSYCSVETADAYHADRGNGNAWSVLNTARKGELLRAGTDYMAIYSAAWKGSRVSGAQALDWPRKGVEAFGFDLPVDVVPLSVQHACAALALLALTGPLVPDTAAAVKSKKLGPLEIVYADPVAPATVKRFPEVDRIVAGLLAQRSRYSAPLVRG